MRGMSRGKSPPTSQSRRRTLGRCKGNIDTEDVLVIDVDMVILDVPESSNQGSKGLKASRRNITIAGAIIIDDEDEDTDDASRIANRDVGRKNCPAYSRSPLREEVSTHEPIISVGKGIFPSESTPKMRMYAERHSPRNCFGFDLDSESSISKSDSDNTSESTRSESDSSDCEIEDSSGNIREQWERAASRKHLPVGDQFASNDQASPSVCPMKPFSLLSQSLDERLFFSDSSESKKSVYEPPSDNSQQLEDRQPNGVTVGSCINEEETFEEPFCNHHEGNEITDIIPIHTQPDKSHLQNDLIGNRERHKESDEFKRAAEEEWASRQLQLQIQAEEAQRLRKRKKDERRLLDMEKRQKQRLEEVRESQRKDEETIILKEKLRAEVRKELDMVELRYRDMASLLRGLGINVEGGLFPMSREVNAAYKQALLRFHPDRSSRNDIRQQVEAEEKFKLISRLKEKLMPS